MFEDPIGYTPEGFEVRSCRSCQADIVWAATSGGKAMPVDAEPVGDGNVELRATGIGHGVLATVLSETPLFAEGALRKSHFATCPDADEWRAK